MVSRVNKIGGQQPRSLSPQEGPPPGVPMACCGAEAGGGQDPADGTARYRPRHNTRLRSGPSGAPPASRP
jgi:hypothetical protein